MTFRPFLFRFLLPALLCGTVAGSVNAREKIGLVLGGGGAKGFAHIGVLKALEEQRIPIDYIVGTSMGAIIAGLYASGMSPEEIESAFLAVDWWELLKDQTPHDELHFRRKEDDQRYLLDLELGVGKSGIKMPRGAAAGQKFNNLMHGLTLRVAGISDFDDLPIPCRTVATDLKTGEVVVLDKGRLSVAMRASMAIPGVFTPVVLEDRILVDGGVVNNIPVDVAWGMGADVVIAVDLGVSMVEEARENLDSLGGMLGQSLILLQRPGQLKQLEDADVIIAPRLAGVSSGAFQQVADITLLGGPATRAVANELARHAVDEKAYRIYLQGQRRPLPGPRAIRTLNVTGNQRVDLRALKKRIQSRPGGPLNEEQVRLDLMHMYGIGEFEQVRFFVSPVDSNTADLEYRVDEKDWGPGYLRFGLRLESDFENHSTWGFLVNYTRMSLNRLAGEWRNDIQVGDRSRFFSEVYQPLDFGGFSFIAPSVEYQSEFYDVYDGDDHLAEYDVNSIAARLHAGFQLKHYAELRFGPVWKDVEGEVGIGSADLPEADDLVSGIEIRLSADQTDQSVLPRSGYRALVQALIADASLGGDVDYERASVFCQQFHSRGEHTFVASVHGGSSFDSELPPYDQFRLGGQASFLGFAPDQLRGNYFGVGSIGYRHRVSRLSPSVGDGIYVVARLDAGNVWEDRDDIDTDTVLIGGGVGVAADTLIGPMYLVYGRAEGGFDRLYFSIGTRF